MLRWSGIKIDPAWIDYNGHLNMAAYLVIFDRGIDRLIDEVGLSSEPGKAPTLYALSCKVDYLREVNTTDRMECVTGVAALDEKRVHSWQELLVGGEVRARCENLHIHVDRAASRAAPFGAEVADRLRALEETPPDWLGSAVAGRFG